jgi:hypothetical protein
MCSWRYAPALLLLVSAVGCKDKAAQDDPVSQALAQAASAQAIASSVAAQAQAMAPGQPAPGKPQSLNDTLSGALAQAASAQALASAAMAQSQPSVAGRVHSTGGELGTWDIALDACQSGQNSGFFGVDFFVSGSSDMRVRYVHDEAAGDVVKVAIPSKPGSALVFDRAAKCAVLEGSVEKTNFNTWTPKGNVAHLNGHVKFDCAASGGKGHVSGEAIFTHCH